MAKHPSRKAENALQSAAANRRRAAGPPFTPHPADRRVLQTEVRRQFKPSTPPQTSGWTLWPRWTILGASLATLVLAGFGWWQFQGPPQAPISDSNSTTASSATRTNTVAKHKLAENPVRVAAATPPPLSGPSTGAPMEETRDVASQPKPTRVAPQPTRSLLPRPTDSATPASPAAPSTQTTRQLASSPTQPMPASRSTPLSSSSTAAGAASATPSRVRLASESKTASPPPTPPTRPEADPVSARFESVAVPTQTLQRQRFEQATPELRRNLNSPPRPVILQSFELRQTPAGLAVIDSDGSSYAAHLTDLALTPAIRPTETEGLLRPQERSAVQPRPPSTTPAPGGLQIEFSGKNLTLQQDLHFRGQLIPASPITDPSRLATHPPISNAHVLGTATIGNQSLRIDARSVPVR